MGTKDDGGPAFARTGDHGQFYTEPQDGLSVRDYMAAHAPFTVTPSVSLETDTKLRYAWADAMLKARDA